MNDAIKMQISAFVDGELPDNEAELLLRRMSQDRELRQQAAEYLCMGRALRGERSVANRGQLRDRISAVLDDKKLQDEFDTADTVRPGFMRPVVGVAIAATVALVALLGLQQISAVPDADTPAADQTVAGVLEDGAYTEPEQGDDQLRDYYLRHTETAAYFGIDSINPEVFTLDIREAVIIETEEFEQPVDENMDEAEASSTQNAQEQQTP